MKYSKLSISHSDYPVRIHVESRNGKKSFTAFSESMLEIPPGHYLVRVECARNVEVSEFSIAPGASRSIDLRWSRLNTPVPVRKIESGSAACAEIYDRWNSRGDDFGRLRSCVQIFSRSMNDGETLRENWLMLSGYESFQSPEVGTKLLPNQICEPDSEFFDQKAGCRMRRYVLKFGFYHIVQKYSGGGHVLGVPVVNNWNTSLFCFHGERTDFKRALVFLTPSHSLETLEERRGDILLCELLLNQLGRQDYETVVETFDHYHPTPSENPVACICYLYSLLSHRGERSSNISRGRILLSEFPLSLSSLPDLALLRWAFLRGSNEKLPELNSPPMFYEGWNLAAKLDCNSGKIFGKCAFMRNFSPSVESTNWFCLSLNPLGKFNSWAAFLIRGLLPSVIRSLKKNHLEHDSGLSITSVDFQEASNQSLESHVVELLRSALLVDEKMILQLINNYLGADLSKNTPRKSRSQLQPTKSKVLKKDESAIPFTGIVDHLPRLKLSANLIMPHLFKVSARDVGSSPVQIASLTIKILSLTDHCVRHRHDFSSQRGLKAAVAQRRRHLDYLNKNNHGLYLEVISKLGLKDRVTAR